MLKDLERYLGWWIDAAVYRQRIKTWDLQHVRDRGTTGKLIGLSYLLETRHHKYRIVITRTRLASAVGTTANMVQADDQARQQAFEEKYAPVLEDAPETG